MAETSFGHALEVLVEVLATHLRWKFWPRTYDWERSVVWGVAGRLDDVRENRKLVLQTPHLSRTTVHG